MERSVFEKHREWVGPIALRVKGTEVLPTCFSYSCSHLVWVFFHVEMEHFLRPSGFSVCPGSAWYWCTSFLTIWHFTACYTTWNCLFHTASSLVIGFPPLAWTAFSISVHQQALYTSLHLTACCSVGYHFHTHLNVLPQFFFLDSFSFNYFVRSTWFISCFVLEQTYFTRLRVSDPVPHCPWLPPLLCLKVPEISWGTWAEECVYPC